MTGVKCVQVYYVLCGFCTICEVKYPVSTHYQLLEMNADAET